MATHNLALVLKSQQNDAEFLVIKQNPPPKFEDREYDSFQDSPLWDLPSTTLLPLEAKPLQPTLPIRGLDADLSKFDLDSALQRVMEQVGCEASDGVEWRVLKVVQEPEFGPGLPIWTVYVEAKLVTANLDLPGVCKWMSVESCLDWLVDVKPNSDRVGPLVVIGVLNDSTPSSSRKVHTSLRCQEYPPGIVLVPMKSRTGKPFRTTNLVIYAPETLSADTENCTYVVQGDAMIVDPGCLPDVHGELENIVATLPRKLVVFVTHHHPDHVDGLSAIQKCNPDAILLAHENTMRRISKDNWSLGYVSVSGGDVVSIGGQKLNVIFAPGHTDGHVGLLHIGTHSLVVGDHCVGQGSALLDWSSGGNMTEYFKTTYKFIDMAPHMLIPMHGRVNLWPKHMLCGYLKNRRSREASILSAIENGANTLLEIVSTVYAGTDRGVWPFAASNVRLHVEHLAEQNKLPEKFSLEKYQRSCGLKFLLGWTCAYVSDVLLQKFKRPKLLIVAGAVASFAMLYTLRNRVIPKQKTS